MTTIQIGNKSQQYTIGASGNTYVLGSGNYVNSPDNGIYEDETRHNNIIQIDGSVTSADSAGIASRGEKTLVHIGKFGSVSGNSGVDTHGVGARIVNDGKISGDTYSGYIVDSTNGSLVNNGVMKSVFRVAGSDNYHMEFAAKSSLTAKYNALEINNAGNQKAHVSNHGTISGATAIEGGWGEETVINRGILAGAVRLAGDDDVLDNRGGTIKGLVDLGEGADRFDNRGGHVDSAISGGTGDDTYVLDTVIKLVEAKGQGIDTVKSSTSVDFHAGLLAGEQLENITLFGTKAANAFGNGLDNALTGNSAGNYLYGLGGNDVLKGGGGIDTFYGGDGHDHYYVDQTADHVIETNSNLAKGGFDFVHFSGTSGTYTLGDNLEGLILESTKAVNGTGNGLNNSIKGNGAANTLSGLGGSDYIIAGSGSDIVKGGVGNDGLFGENGEDFLYGGSGKDTVSGGTGNDVVSGGADADTFYFARTFDHDTISDFEDGLDHLNLFNFGAIDTVAEFRSHAHQQGSDVVFDFGSGDTLTIQNIKLSSLTSLDFSFDAT